MTTAARQRALRARRRAQGLQEVRGIWAPPEQHQRIKQVVQWIMAGHEYICERCGVRQGKREEAEF